MTIKNAIIYTIENIAAITAEALEGRLFTPCGRNDLKSTGFFAPVGFTELLPKVGDYALLCLKTELKDLPPSVVNKALSEKIAEIEAREDRKIYSKEKAALKDEIISDLLPRAFTKERRTNAIICYGQGLIIIDASSYDAAELLLRHLREALGSLNCLPLMVNLSPTIVMTGWLGDSGAHGLYEGLEISDRAKLVQAGADGASHVCRNQDLFSEEVRAHLVAGKQVVELGLSHDHNSFVLYSDLRIKGIKFAQELMMEAEEQGNGDKYAERRAQLMLVGHAMRNMVVDIADAFGGQLEKDEGEI